MEKNKSYTVSDLMALGGMAVVAGFALIAAAMCFTRAAKKQVREMTIPELQQLRRQFVLEEEYEKAAFIRDLILSKNP